MPTYMKQPSPLVSVEQAKEAVRLWESGDNGEFSAWCEQNGRMVADALRAWAALEFLLQKTSIDGITWWISPGCYGLKTLDTPEHMDDADDDQWQLSTLHEVICDAAADFAAADEPCEIEEETRG